MKPKVTLIIIAPIKEGYKVNETCFDSWLGQDYENFDIVFHFEKPTYYDPKSRPDLPPNALNTYKNCSFNRNVARKMALTTNAEYFLFVDDDVELPKDAISQFMLQTGIRKTTISVIDPRASFIKTILSLFGKEKFIPKGTINPEIHIQGGWYPLYGKDDGKLGGYPAGIYIKNNTFIRYLAPEFHLVDADFVGAGCLFITREALEKLEFEDGLTTWDYMATGEKVVDGEQTLITERVIAGECLAFGIRAYEKGYRMKMNGYVICKHHVKIINQ